MVEITPRITPWSRRCRTRARVSMSASTGIVPLHVLVGHLLRAPVGADPRKLAHDQALNIGPRGLVIVLVGAVVADLGIGENDDLAGIGGIGEDFLIAGNGSVKNNFAVAFALLHRSLCRGRCARLRAQGWPAFASPRSGFFRF